MEVPGDRAPRAAGDGGNLAARYYFNGDDHVQVRTMITERVLIRVRSSISSSSFFLNW
jgi:hypothetical protein